MRLDRFSIRTRLIILIVAAISALALAASYAIWIQRNQMLVDRHAKLDAVLELAHSLTAGYATRAEKGQISQAAAQEAARLALRLMRFEGDNYITLVDTDMNMIEHPIRPEMNGKNFSDLKESEGNGSFSSRAK